MSPRPDMSAASSGGVSSSVSLTDSTIARSGSWKAERTSWLVRSTLLGRPLTRSAADLRRELPLERVRRADLELEVLGHLRAHGQVVGAPEVGQDRVVELVPADAQERETTMEPRR